MSAPSSLDFTIERRAGIDVVVFANDSCRPAMETELAMWSRLASSTKPITHVVVADTKEFGTVACGYSGSSDEISRAVMAKACAQGYSGTYQDRLAELGWRVEPAYLAVPPEAQTFQEGVSDWMAQCFVPSLYSNMTERGDRLLEEVLELLQAHGYDPTRVATLVDYVFNRPVGQPAQEVGGVMVTLAGYCWVAGLDMHAAGDAELVRITQPEVMANIRAKQEAKNALHFDTPLPGTSPAAPGIDLAPRPMATAPRDGTMLRLLVRFDDHATEDTIEPAWTIGHCSKPHPDDDDNWQFAGWCWDHDHFTEGKGTPVGWLPLIDASPKGGSDGATPAANETDWRVKAAAWLEERAAEQENTNRAYPAHVEAYPSWTDRVHWLLTLASKVSESQATSAKVPA